MKKLILLSIMAMSMPLQLMAQDDMYFVPTRELAEQTAREYGLPRETYYHGSTRSIDDYNRHGSYYEVIDSLASDTIDFTGMLGVYPDSLYDEADDYVYTRRMSRFDDYQWSDSYWAGYAAGRYSRFGWYSPWYYDSWYYSPWSYSSWYGGWYDPWYYGGWYRPYGYYGYYGYYGHPHYYGYTYSRPIHRGGTPRARFGSTPRSIFGTPRTGNTTTRRSSFGNTRTYQPRTTTTTTPRHSTPTTTRSTSSSSFGGSHGGGSFGGGGGGGFGRHR